MLKRLGDLQWPFVAGAAALLALSFVVATWDVPGWRMTEAAVTGLVAGALLCVVLYAVMVALVQRR